MASTPVSDAAHCPVEPSGAHAISRRPGRGRRVSTATSWPAAVSDATSARPRKPVPPAMTTRMAPIVTRGRGVAIARGPIGVCGCA